MKKSQLFDKPHARSLVWKQLACISFAFLLGAQTANADVILGERQTSRHEKEFRRTRALNRKLEALSRNLAAYMQDKQFRSYCITIASQTQAIVALTEFLQPGFALEAGVTQALRGLLDKAGGMDHEFISKIKISVPIESLTEIGPDPLVAFVPLGIFGYLTNHIKAFDSQGQSYHLSEDTTMHAPVMLIGYFEGDPLEIQPPQTTQTSYSREECVGCWSNGTSCRVFVQRCHYCCTNCDFSKRCGACFGWWNKVGPCYPN